MTSGNEDTDSFLWRNREIWGHGIVWIAISAGVGMQREEFVKTTVVGTLVGCFIGYLQKCYREGKEESFDSPSTQHARSIADGIFDFAGIVGGVASLLLGATSIGLTGFVYGYVSLVGPTQLWFPAVLGVAAGVFGVVFATGGFINRGLTYLPAKLGMTLSILGMLPFTFVMMWSETKSVVLMVAITAFVALFLLLLWRRRKPAR